ncbi:50S ribosomal protein L10 [Dermatophilus congolensis]|uniref:50S ribosomal protein L10 n=1 Tax=Dermatophilus congolensis TaxID=1863 RepID=UPI001AAF7A58|nr:50S ribosomal protein L10 [Dermatophilus congolensis]MBO3143191.1 50S ribosomal protein L10 [Dermatophilus congolensis]MBO3152177.1 50S ribosomal protein L10 [Dermatophilus congolensis]MBO3160810.1 50S ribosomal protein L10 [Dermatophilus congolensis]MBO3163465.1 50S ribosomal protein L10 [Dermatophilus congolensis]MBO3177015.1 50S ribosomal protein L10 [Dermatophilus congolensis]
MATPAKQAAIAELEEKFRESGAAVLTEYRGLTVAQLAELRTQLRPNGSYSVVKNTLTQIAATNAGVTAFDGKLSGPTAVAFVSGDPVAAAKTLRDFAKANDKLVIKGAVLDGKTLSAEEVAQLADLESREVLLAKLAGGMKAKISQAAYMFVAPLSKAARTVDALRAKTAEGTPSADEAAAE